MAQNKENIEAKLAEYVEGTLDAAGRAEIERHLVAHSEHRGLIADLTATKSVLRRMPRQSAPEDLTEVLQGRLERAVLLDGADNAAVAGSLRLRRWPQILSMAAIVLLTVGLGLVVYVTLPSAHPSGFTIVEKEVPSEMGVAPPAGTAAPDRGSATRGPDATPESGELANAERGTADQPAAAQPPTMTPEPSGALGTVAADAGREAASPLRLDQFFAFGLGQRLAAPVTDDEVVVVMAGSDPLFDENRVVTLFRRQNLQWERIEQAGEPLSAVETTNGPSGGRLLLRSATDAPAEADDGAGAFADAQPLDGDADATATPAEALAMEQGPVAQATRDRGREPRRSEAAEMQQLAPGAGAKQNSYVVRGITRQQAGELLDSLSKDESMAVARLYNWNGAGDTVINALPRQQEMLAEELRQGQGYRGGGGAGGQAGLTTRDQAVENESLSLPESVAPAARSLGDTDRDGVAVPIAAGEALRIEIDQLVGPGVTPVVEQRVDELGQLKLQMIPTPVQAEGRTPGDLEREIADRYRQSDLIENPTVRVMRPGATTQQVGQARANAADAGDRVDLIVVVQSAQSATDRGLLEATPPAAPPEAPTVQPPAMPLPAPTPTTQQVPSQP